MLRSPRRRCRLNTTRTLSISSGSRPLSRSRATPSSDKATDTLRFDVDGMTCATCATRVERVLARQEGVANASVNLAGASASVDVAAGTDPAGLVAAVDK